MKARKFLKKHWPAILAVVSSVLILACTVGGARRAVGVGGEIAQTSAEQIPYVGDVAGAVMEAQVSAMQARLDRLEAQRGPDGRMSLEDWLYVFGIVAGSNGLTAAGVNAHRNRTRSEALRAREAESNKG